MDLDRADANLVSTMNLNLAINLSDFKAMVLL
jgi:hypothetical protein